MSIRRIYLTTKRVLRRVSHILAKPVKRDRGSGGALIQPYNGYGSPEEVYLMGRVYRQPPLAWRENVNLSQQDLLNLLRRMLRRGIGQAKVAASLCDKCADGDQLGKSDVTQVVTDSDGYFQVRLRPGPCRRPGRFWHSVQLDLVEPSSLVNGAGSQALGQVYIPPSTAQRIIISDIDDTVMYTGVVNKIKMIWRLFLQGANSRVAFPGVASLYRALYGGPSGDQFNPILYVSRGPWSIYEVLQEFFRLHRIPVGPVLFLREWGISLQRPLPKPAEEHKLKVIRDMLELYHDYPFVLIGDSGQHDPEVYTRVVQEYPGRIVAVYIRNVSRSTRRIRAIEELAKQVIAAGSGLVLAADSLCMAEHAAEHGLIPTAAIDEVLREQQSQPDPTSQKAAAKRVTKKLQRTSREKTQEAIERGELEIALKESSQAETPPNITVESKD